MTLIQSIEENGANKENYEQAQQTIDKVLSTVSALKESESNNELKRQIEELDSAYERAIRLRMMRIDTLTGHCEDRDAELVKLRREKAGLLRAHTVVTNVLRATVLLGVLLCLNYAFPGQFAVFGRLALDFALLCLKTLQESALCAAAASCALTFAVQRLAQ